MLSQSVYEFIMFKKNYQIAFDDISNNIAPTNNTKRASVAIAL